MATLSSLTNKDVCIRHIAGYREAILSLWSVPEEKSDEFRRLLDENEARARQKKSELSKGKSYKDLQFDPAELSERAKLINALGVPPDSLCFETAVSFASSDSPPSRTPHLDPIQLTLSRYVPGWLGDWNTTERAMSRALSESMMIKGGQVFISARRLVSWCDSAEADAFRSKGAAQVLANLVAPSTLDQEEIFPLLEYVEYKHRAARHELLGTTSELPKPELKLPYSTPELLAIADFMREWVPYLDKPGKPAESDAARYLLASKLETHGVTGTNKNNLDVILQLVRPTNKRPQRKSRTILP